MYIISCCDIREVTRRKSKSGAAVKHQRKFVVLKTTSNVKWLFLKSSTAPLYCSLVTSLDMNDKLCVFCLYVHVAKEMSRGKCLNVFQVEDGVRGQSVINNTSDSYK